MPDETNANPEEPQGTDWKAEARKHEKREKDHKTALERANARIAELEAELEGKSSDERARSEADEKLAKELAEARAENKRLKAQRERDRNVREAAAKAGVDPDVLVRMHGDTEEEIAANVELLTRSSKRKWPVVNDEGGQEPPRLSRKEILAIKDAKERRRAIAENLDLFRED